MVFNIFHETINNYYFFNETFNTALGIKNKILQKKYTYENIFNFSFSLFLSLFPPPPYN